MAALVSVETVLLVLLLVLVAGLLRSHAEILRRLGPGETDGNAGLPGSRPGLAPRLDGALRRAAPALSGVSPAGDAAVLDFERAEGTYTLLAFLTTGCGTCAGFWQTLAEPRLPDEVAAVIVTRGADQERPAGVRALAPAGVPVVMSRQAWLDYEVPGAPYFVLVERTILGEGVAGSWQALASLVSDALEEERAPGAMEPARGGGGRAGGPERRARRIDETLRAGGIGPGHPSLHPGGVAERRG